MPEEVVSQFRLVGGRGRILAEVGRLWGNRGGQRPFEEAVGRREGVADGRRRQGDAREDSERGRVSGELLSLDQRFRRRSAPKTAGRGRREQHGQADGGGGFAEEGEVSRGAGRRRRGGPGGGSDTSGRMWLIVMVLVFDLLLLFVL